MYNILKDSGNFQLFICVVTYVGVPTIAGFVAGMLFDMWLKK